MNQLRKARGRRANNAKFPFLALVLALITMMLLATNRTGQAARSAGGQVFTPLIATDSRAGLPPTLRASVQLENAFCPNDIAINEHSGLVYVTNEISNNVSLLDDGIHVGNIETGTWPIWVESDPESDTVYVSNVVTGITVLNGGNISHQIAPYHEAYNITVNTVNDTVYVEDLHRPITIIKNRQRVTDLTVPDFDNSKIEWQLASGFDAKTGLTYFASWQHGVLTVIDDQVVVDQYLYYGEGAKDMVIDPDRRLLYLANFRAGEDGRWLDNLSIVNMDTRVVTGISTAKQSRHLALDASTGYVYVTNPKNDTVTVLSGTSVLATYPVGKRPWGVTVDQFTGFAYVANSGDNTISVFRNGQPVTQIELPAGMGYEPWQIAVDPATQEVYVVNRSSRDVQTDHVRDALKCDPPWVHILR